MALRMMINVTDKNYFGRYKEKHTISWVSIQEVLERECNERGSSSGVAMH